MTRSMLYLQADDGTWTEAVVTPLGHGLHFETVGTGPYRWELYRADQRLNSGRCRTCLGLLAAMLRARLTATKET